jgi:hypothetical protein
MGGVRVRKKKTLTLPSPASGRGSPQERMESAGAPLLPLAGEGWDEGLLP